MKIQHQFFVIFILNCIFTSTYFTTIEEHLVDVNSCNGPIILKKYQEVATRMGIPKEWLPALYFMKSTCSYKGHTLDNCGGFYDATLNVIAINPNIGTDPLLTHTLAHELEHCKQHHKAPGSYHGDNDALKETGADTAATKLIECSFCLESLKSLSYYQQVLRKFKGYFLPDHYNSFKEEAKQAGVLCTQHTQDFTKNFTPCTDQNLLTEYHKLATEVMGLKPEDVPTLMEMKESYDDDQYAKKDFEKNSAILRHGENIIALHPDHDTLDHYHFKYNIFYLLEFVRQNKNYTGSYANGNVGQKSKAAEAAALGAFDCPSCLLQIQDNIFPAQRSFDRYRKDDVDPYIKRAQEEGCLCSEHQKERDTLGTPCTDTKTLELYQTLAQAMKIKPEDLPTLCYASPSHPLPKNNSFKRCAHLNLVIIDPNTTMDTNPLTLQYYLAFYIESIRQKNKYPGSYHGNDSKLKKTAIDAAVAGTFDCSACLQNIQATRSKDENAVNGFNQSAYDPYIQRAQEEGCTCAYHKNKKKQELMAGLIENGKELVIITGQIGSGIVLGHLITSLLPK